MKVNKLGSTYFRVSICRCVITDLQLPAQNRIPESSLLARPKHFFVREGGEMAKIITSALITVNERRHGGRLTSHSLLQVLVETAHGELLQCWIC